MRKAPPGFQPESQDCRTCGSRMELLEEFVQHCTCWCPKCGTVLEAVRGLPLKDGVGWRVPSSAGVS